MDEKKIVSEWQEHWQDEADAQYLYGELATFEPDPQRRKIWERLADVEARHTEVWRNLLADHGVDVETPRVSLKARLLVWVAKRFGPKVLITRLLREEGQEVKGYLALHRRSSPGTAREAALMLAKESAEHAEELRHVAGRPAGEPWHRTGSGDFLRNVIYGFNDGLTANFGLVAGVLGATTGSTEHFVLISGMAGMVADALSMGSSGFLAAKSQREVHAKEIEIERQEIALMPEVETDELALIYEARGVETAQARHMAETVMESPERALEQKITEELGITEPASTPLREGWITGLATAVGAFIPVAPFLFAHGAVAIWLAFSIAMLSHFAVGAARSLFTGRGLFRSGLDMFVVGMGIAGIGFLVGQSIERLL
jgi:VIT1/CCC1 family predicted Fe2+/Mn2+ transporter